MAFLKPKDVARKINVSPTKVSRLASDIDAAKIYSFNRTALGSFLFREQDVPILKEYADLLRFFNRKKEALEMLKQQLESSGCGGEERKEWAKFLYNSKFLLR